MTNATIEEEDEGFLSGVKLFRYFDDDGSLDYSQAAFDALPLFI